MHIDTQIYIYDLQNPVLATCEPRIYFSAPSYVYFYKFCFSNILAISI